MHEVKPLSFIYEIKNALPGELCRDMIRRFEANADQQYAGRIGQGQAEESGIKKTTDPRISGRTHRRGSRLGPMQVSFFLFS